jgi:hypothetical protein
MFTSIGRYSSGRRKLCIHNDDKTIATKTKETFTYMIRKDDHSPLPLPVVEDTYFPNDDSDSMWDSENLVGDDTDAEDQDDDDDDDDEYDSEVARCLTRKRKAEEPCTRNDICGIFDEISHRYCQRPKYVKSMCRYHYKKWLSKTRCKFSSATCTKVAKKDGLCWAHLYGKNDNGICALCSNKVFCKGLCRSHYRKTQKKLRENS